jgi:hypothetical protein
MTPLGYFLVALGACVLMFVAELSLYGWAQERHRRRHAAGDMFDSEGQR